MPVETTRYAKGAPEDFGALFHEEHGTPRLVLTLRPHKSLTPPGFVWFIGLTAGLMALPLIAVLGRSVLWGVLPFVLIAIAAIWWGLKRSWSDMELHEELVIWDGVRRIPEGGKVPDYVTMKAEGREVEIGAFLAPSERRDLHALLEREIFPNR